MNRREIEAYLLELDEAFAEAFPSPEPMRVLVVGGACLLLADVTTRATKDIDVIITDLEGQGGYCPYRWWTIRTFLPIV